MFIDTNLTVETTVLARCVLQDAAGIAAESGDGQVRTQHLLSAILNTGIESSVGELVIVDDESTTDYLLREWKEWQDAASPVEGIASYEEAPKYGGFVKEALRFAVQEAPAEVDTEHILLGLTLEPSGVAGRFLAKHGVTADKLREALQRITPRDAERELTPA